MAITYNKICNRCNTPYESVNTLMQRCPACRIIEATEAAQPQITSTYHYEPSYVIYEETTIVDYIGDAIPALILWGVVLWVTWPILKIFYNVFQ